MPQPKWKLQKRSELVEVAEAVAQLDGQSFSVDCWVTEELVEHLPSSSPESSLEEVPAETNRKDRVVIHVNVFFVSDELCRENWPALPFLVEHDRSNFAGVDNFSGIPP